MGVGGSAKCFKVSSASRESSVDALRGRTKPEQPCYPGERPAGTLRVTHVNRLHWKGISYVGHQSGWRGRTVGSH